MPLLPLYIQAIWQREIGLFGPGCTSTNQLTELTPNAVTSQSNNGGGRRNENEAQKFWLHSVSIFEFSVRFCN